MLAMDANQENTIENKQASSAESDKEVTKRVDKISHISSLRHQLICGVTNRLFIVLGILSFILIGLVGIYYWVELKQVELPKLPLLPLVFLQWNSWRFYGNTEASSRIGNL